MTSSIRSIIFSATTKSIPSPWEGSSWIWSLVKGVHIANKGFHFLNRVKRYKLSNAPLILTGVALEIAVGDRKIVNALAKILEASLYSLKAIRAYVRIVNGIKKIQKILRFETHPVHKYQIDKASELPLLSASTWVILLQRKESINTVFYELLEAIFEIAANFVLMCSYSMQACESLEGHAFQVIEAPMNIVDIIQEVRALDRSVYENINDTLLEEMGASFKSKQVFEKYIPQVEAQEEPREGLDVESARLVKKSFSYIGEYLKYSFVPDFLLSSDQLPSFQFNTGNSKRGTLKIVKDLKSINTFS